MSDIKQLGVEKVLFETLKTPLTGEFMTLCFFFDKEKTLLSRGVSLCSVKDNYRPKVGRNKAFGRAFKALNRKETSEPFRFEDRWAHKYAERSFKITNDSYIKDMQEDIDHFQGKYSVQQLGEKKGEKLFKVKVHLPLDYHLKVIQYNFPQMKHKATYRPNQETISPLEEVLIEGIELNV